MTTNPLATYLRPRFGAGTYTVEVKVDADYLPQELSHKQSAGIDVFTHLRDEELIGEAVFLQIEAEDVSHDVTLGRIFGPERNCNAFIGAVVQYIATDGEQGIPRKHEVNIAPSTES